MSDTRLPPNGRESLTPSRHRVRVIITGEYELRESDYTDPGDVAPTPEQMALVDAKNYEGGGVSESDLIDWLEPDTVKVTFEVVS